MPPPKKETRLSKVSQKKKTQRQVNRARCTFSQIPQISIILRYGYPKTCKIIATIFEINKSYENLSNNYTNNQNTKQSIGNDLTPMLVPTTLAVSGILPSCPRVMTMQCWKSSIPPPLSTRLCIIDFSWVVPAKRKETRLRKIPQRNNNSKTSEKNTLHTLPKSPHFQEYEDSHPSFQNHYEIH